MPSEALHLFFDTTEVTGDASSSNLGRIASLRLLKAARKIGAQLYVSDLSVTEFVNQRMRHVEKQLAIVRKSVHAIKPYVKMPDFNAPSQEDLEQTLRQTVERELAGLGVEIFSVNEFVELGEVLKLSTNRIPPFRDGHDPRGFHDAVILLGCLKYARAAGLQEIVFVSNDTDHADDVVQRLAKEHDVACRLVTHSDIATQMMEDLAAAEVKSFVSAVVGMTTEFMEKHRQAIEAYLETHPPKIRDFFPLTPLLPFYKPPLEVMGLKIGRLAAIPAQAPKEGMESAIAFYVNVIGEFVIEEYPMAESPIADMEAKPGVTVQAPLFGSLARALGPAPIPQRVSRSVELSMIGKARALFKGDQFVGAPTIESLEVRSPDQNPYSGVSK